VQAVDYSVYHYIKLLIVFTFFRMLMMERLVLVILVVEELTLLLEDQTNLLSYGVVILPQVCVCACVCMHVCVREHL